MVIVALFNYSSLLYMKNINICITNMWKWVKYNKAVGMNY